MLKNETKDPMIALRDALYSLGEAVIEFSCVRDQIPDKTLYWLFETTDELFYITYYWLEELHKRY